MQLIPASLLALLPLTIAGPIDLHQSQSSRDTNPGCTDASFGDFGWTIENFDFHASYIFTTPAHQNSWGYVNFNLSNPALTYEASCSAASSQLSDFFYGNLWYTCTLPEGTPPGTSSAFQFDRPSGKLDFNQTWTCSDTDPRYPITFRGYGSVNLTLECTDTTWTNPDWSVGQVYSDREVKCAPVTVGTVKPYRITAVAKK